MRLRWIAIIFFILVAFVSGASAQQGAQADPTGSWMFVWQNDSANTNPVTLKYEGGAVSGTYINDAKEKCPVAGSWDLSGSKVSLTIVCPRWEIKCEGSIKDPKLVTGRYFAYGSTEGDFRLLRQ